MTVATEPTSLVALLRELGLKQVSVEKQPLRCAPGWQPTRLTQPLRISL